ncbi:MAG: hypothetical protein ABSG67_11380 [Thermoguttaceae bacterium]
MSHYMFSPYVGAAVQLLPQHGARALVPGGADKLRQAANLILIIRDG